MSTPARPTGRLSPRSTRADRFLTVLSDHQWHTTSELVRRVGHTFGGAKFGLIHQGHVIERRPHPTRRYQHQYRLRASQMHR